MQQYAIQTANIVDLVSSWLVYTLFCFRICYNIMHKQQIDQGQLFSITWFLFIKLAHIL